MKYIFTLLLVSVFSQVKAVELNYKWKANSTYRFTATQKDDISISAMGMNSTEKFTTTVEFVLFIQSVDTAGTAKGRLYLTTYSVKDGKGMALASLTGLPKDAVQSAITVDKKGHFTFEKEVTLVTTPTANYLVYAKADQNSASAGFETGTEKVDVYAAFDPKTGKLKAGYTTTTMNKTKPTTINKTENSDELNVFPYDFLELMIMPDGNINQGDHYSVDAGIYNVQMDAVSVLNGLVVLNETVKTDKSKDQFSGGASGQTQDGSFNMGTFGGMEGLATDSEDKEALDMTKAMSPDLTGNFTVNFDSTIGMFSSVKGNLSTVVDAMGMKMTVNSVLDMKKK